MKKIYRILIICFGFSLFSCFPVCDRTEECPGLYQFTLPFNVENLVDTISVGDTFQFTHSIPRYMVENINGQEYNLSGLFTKYAEHVEIAVVEFKGKNYYAAEKDFFSFNEIEKHGTIVPQSLGPAVVYIVSFEEDDNGLYFKCNIVVHQQGVFGLSLYTPIRQGQLEGKIKNIIDTTCCQRNVTINYNYSFNNGLGANQDWLDNYPILYSDGISPVEKAELLEEEVFLFYVKE